MGKFYKSFSYLLGLLCAAAFAFPALAADKVNLPVDRHGYLKVTGDTFRHPTTTKIREAISGANPHVEKLPGGGLSQSLPSNIEITANKQTSPISAKVKIGAQSLKNGAKNLLKGGLAGIVLTEGLEQLFDAVDWVMGEGGQIQQKSVDGLEDLGQSPYPGAGYTGHMYPTLRFKTAKGFCSYWRSNYLSDTPESVHVVGSRCEIYYSYGGLKNYTAIVYHSGSCWEGSELNDGVCVNQSAGAPVDVSVQDIDDAVDNYYQPEPSDWELIARYTDLAAPDVFAEIASIPSILTPPTTKTIYDADGNPVEVQETNIWYDFDILDNNSKQPSIDMRENKETKTYDSNGNLTGRETTTSTSKALSSSSASSDATFDIPTDCEFMPTVCRFLSWFQEPDPELANEPDLKALRHDLEPERNFTVGTSTAGCPAPIQINLAMFPSVEVSLQPLCDFVDLLRPLLLAFAFYFAGRIVLRT